MTLKTQSKIREVRSWLIAKYPGYMTFEAGERALLAFAYLCDVLKVREKGTNRGEWVEAFLDAAGVAPGNPWCASALTFACLVAEAPTPDRGDALVAAWQFWVIQNKRKLIKPERGAIAMHNAGGGKGHIGIVIKVVLIWVYSIEGNTGPVEKGSQRDGDGIYRRVRLRKFWSWGFGKL